MAGRTTRDWRWLMIVIAAVIVALDRVTKQWIVKNILPGSAIDVWPHVFRLTHVLNTGAAFSMFEDAKSQVLVRQCLVGFSVLAVIVVLVLIWKMGRTISPTSIALALILGGAIGNLYDRFRYEYVTDFLEVKIVHYHWPDFNFADSCITIAACLLVLEIFKPPAETSE